MPEHLLVDDQIFWGFQKLVTSVQCEVLASILSFLCLWREFTLGLPVCQWLVARWRTELGLQSRSETSGMVVVVRGIVTEDLWCTIWWPSLLQQAPLFYMLPLIHLQSMNGPTLSTFSHVVSSILHTACRS